MLLALALALAPAVEDVRAPDRRVAALVDRLATAAVARCADRQGRTGLVLHVLDQYAPSERAAIARGFALGDRPAVLALVPGGPAEMAGVREDDTLLAADGEALRPATTGAATFDTLAVALDSLDKGAADGVLTLTLRSPGGAVRDVTLATPPACRVRPLVTGGGERASTDGLYLKVSPGLAARLPDDQLAAALAHELAHVILRHPAALRAAGGRGGLFAAVNGGDARVRRTEEAADRLSVLILADAGLDPAAAVRLWSGWGRRTGGLFDGAHGGWDERVATISAAIAALPPITSATISAPKEMTNGE